MSAGRSKASELQLRVVGMKHRLSRSTRIILSQRVPMQAKLVREPENEADPNAVAVYLRSKPWTGVKLGYLSRGLAREIAPRMDSGRLKILRVTLVSLDVAEDEGELVVKTRSLKSLQKKVI